MLRLDHAQYEYLRSFLGHAIQELSKDATQVRIRTRDVVFDIQTTGASLSNAALPHAYPLKVLHSEYPGGLEETPVPDPNKMGVIRDVNVLATVVCVRNYKKYPRHYWGLPDVNTHVWDRPTARRGLAGQMDISAGLFGSIPLFEFRRPHDLGQGLSTDMYSLIREVDFGIRFLFDADETILVFSPITSNAVELEGITGELSLDPDQYDEISIIGLFGQP